MGAMGAYQTFATGGAPCGGMMNACAQIPAPRWNYYIAVGSVAASAARTTERGGQVIQGPHDVPGGAWIVQARDPQGAPCLRWLARTSERSRAIGQASLGATT